MGAKRGGRKFNGRVDYHATYGSVTGVVNLNIGHSRDDITFSKVN